MGNTKSSRTMTVETMMMAATMMVAATTMMVVAMMILAAMMIVAAMMAAAMTKLLVGANSASSNLLGKYFRICAHALIIISLFRSNGFRDSPACHCVLTLNFQSLFFYTFFGFKCNYECDLKMLKKLPHLQSIGSRKSFCGTRKKKTKNKKTK